MSQNIDKETVKGFGDEWSTFSQQDSSNKDFEVLFNTYFKKFPWASLKENAEGFDLGCGSGRWARFVAPKVGVLHCIDPSKAIEVAKQNLSKYNNCKFHKSSVDAIPLDDDSQDFGYSLGVLHHIPKPFEGLVSCVKKLKPGAPFMVYLYYALDNKPLHYRLIWKCSDILRRFVSKSPLRFKLLFSTIAATVVYLPLAKLSKCLSFFKISTGNIPLSAYQNLSFYTMRTDAFDRFCTRLEHRFTKKEIFEMMSSAGLEKIDFLDSKDFQDTLVPMYWIALGYKKQ